MTTRFKIITTAPTGSNNQVLQWDATEAAAIWADSQGGSSGSASSLEAVQHTIASEVVSGSDTNLAATLNAAPYSTGSVLLFHNGVQQRQGAAADYVLTGSENKTIRWLAGTGTAVDLIADDNIDVYYWIGSTSSGSGGSGTGGLTVTDVKTSDYTAAAFEHVFYNPSAGSPTGSLFTLSSPAAPSNSDKWAIKNSTTSSFMITVSASTDLIEDPFNEKLTGSFEVQGGLISLEWIYNGNWYLV